MEDEKKAALAQCVKENYDCDSFMLLGLRKGGVTFQSIKLSLVEKCLLLKMFDMSIQEELNGNIESAKGVLNERTI